MNSEIPYKRVRRILKENIEGDVSQDGIIYVKEFIECVIVEIAKASIRELEKYNHLRQIQRMPQLKRIPAFIFKKVSTQTYKQMSDFNDEEGGQYNRDTSFSKADVEVV